MIDVIPLFVGAWFLCFSFYLLYMALFSLKTRRNTNRLNGRLTEIEDWIQELYKLRGGEYDE